MFVYLYNMKMVYPRMVTHLSTNPAQCRVTLLLCQIVLPLSQTPYEANDHGLCSRNKLLYKRQALSMERRKFRAPSAPKICGPIHLKFKFKKHVWGPPHLQDSHCGLPFVVRHGCSLPGR